MKAFFLSLLVCVLMVGAGPAEAASTKEFQEQLDELKRVNEAQAKNLATALNQLQEVLGSYQRMNGQVEQSAHLVQEQDKIIKDNQRRMDLLEEKLHQMTTQVEEIKAAGLLPAAQVKRLEEFKEYQTSLTKINADDYKGAITSLKAFMAGHKDSPYAEGAQYWIGESYYAMKDYPAAVTEYQNVIQKFPKGSKAALALLKQGFAFFEIQSFEDSKAFLTKLITKYPASGEAVRAREKINEINRLLELRAKEAVEKKSVM